MTPGENFPEIRTTPIHEIKLKHEETPRWIIIAELAGWLLIAGILIFGIRATAHAQGGPSDEVIVEAIFRAEGGEKATYLYGIRSVHYKDIADARRICFNTVRNNRKRFARQTRYTDFIEFLGSRYCPVSAHPKNRFWVKNVRYYIARAK